ncbi:leukocyte antigen CD37 isoform X2 [Gopherus flavomarginatus]|uniref:leukocyte antigen CD37 isoform X2 n=1 Tax=Gopherus flavomarginatus TaxID=286002 RepID=UPI0021CBBC79|nr:leukocyte antigen CD37 isoform X2 [Gopherus flavomarginatus]
MKPAPWSPPPPPTTTPGRLGPPGAAGLGRVQIDEKPEPARSWEHRGVSHVSPRVSERHQIFPLPLQPPLLRSSLYALKVWSYILSGVGIITMLMGFLGCLGSLKEIKCMLGFYFGFLFLLFAAQITIGVLLYTQRVTLSGKVGLFVEDAIRTYPLAGPPSEKYQSWDFIQGQLQCCGWNSYLDWHQNPVVDNSSRKLYPCSCHNSSSPGERGTNITEASGMQAATGFCIAYGEWPVYRQGCAISVQGWLANNIISIVGVCLGIALMELCLMMLSMFLFRNMGQNYDKLTRYS